MKTEKKYPYNYKSYLTDTRNKHEIVYYISDCEKRLYGGYCTENEKKAFKEAINYAFKILELKK